MNATITAHQLYPPSRIAGMRTSLLRTVLAFAHIDIANGTCYCGMDLPETIATAQRTIADVSAALRARVAE